MVVSGADRPGRRELVGLAVLGLPTLLASMDMSVLYLALPHLSADLGASSVQQLWITDIYGFLIAGFLITMGTLGDRIGRRRLLLIGAAGFAVASVIAAYATSPAMLIAARALLGIAGATLMPSIMALISMMFPTPKQHGMAIAVWMSCFMGGMAIGPVVGGLLLDHFWWGSVFLVGVPVMVLLLAAGPKLLPEYRNPESGRLDLVSVVLSLAFILPVIYGLKEVARHGFNAVPVAAIVIGALIGVVFVRRQLSSPHPLLDLSLFKNSTFRSAVIMTPLSGIMAGTSLFIYQYLQLVDKLTPLQTAFWMLPSTLTTVASIQLAPVLTRHFKPAHAIAAGLVIVTIGYALLTQLSGHGDLALLITGLVVAAIGMGPMATLSTSLALGSVPMQKAGNAAAMSSTAGEFGIAMGVALMGTIGNTVYQHQITGKIPATTPPDAAKAAKESIADAVSATTHLAPNLAEQLLNAARNSLAPALNVSAGLSAIIALIIAALALRAFRHIPPTTTPPTPTETTEQTQAPAAETPAHD